MFRLAPKLFTWLQGGPGSCERAGRGSEKPEREGELLSDYSFSHFSSPKQPTVSRAVESCTFTEDEATHLGGGVDVLTFQSLPATSARHNVARVPLAFS